MALSGFDEVIKFAIEREEEAIQTYGQLSQETQTPGLKALLLELREEEKKHKALLEGLTLEKIASLNVKKISDLKLTDYLVEEPASVEMSIQDLLIYAAKKEQKAVELYSLLFEGAEDEEVKKLFSFMREQEKSHKLRLEKEYEEHVLQED